MKHALMPLLALVTSAAFADCPERLQRDPLFVALAVEEGTPRPASVEDFKFIGDDTTLDELNRKIGTPDATKGAKTFIWCLADGTVISVLSPDGSVIREVRAAGKLVYKRKN